MNVIRTSNGVLIGEKDLKYLTAAEALALLDWLAEQREWLLDRLAEQPQAPAPAKGGSQGEWSALEEAMMSSEDEQIVCFL